MFVETFLSEIWILKCDFQDQHSSNPDVFKYVFEFLIYQILEEEFLPLNFCGVNQKKVQKIGCVISLNIYRRVVK